MRSRRTEANEVVTGLLHVLAGDSHHAGDERFVLLHRFVDSEQCSHIIHYCTSLDWQCAGWYLTTDASVNQLLLTALRVLDFQRTYLNAQHLRCQVTHMLDGIGFIRLDTDDCTADAKCFHHDTNTDEDFLAVLKHQLMVVGQIGLALHTVNNQHLGILARRRHQFNVSGETSAAQTDDAGVLDLLDDIFRFECAIVDQGFRTVDGRQPFVTLHIDKDGGCRITLTVEHVINLHHLAANRRVNGCANEPTCLRKQCTYLHLVAYCYHRLCRRTYVLRQQDNGLLGQRSFDDGLVGRVGLVVMRMNSAYTKCILHNNLQIF